jgi:predicted nucleic acid-binding protein
MATVLVDTSAVYAVVDRNDSCHEKAKQPLGALAKEPATPILTNFIVAECHALLLARHGAPLARRWLFDNTWRVERATEDDEDQAKEIRHSHTDKTFSYTDATSFAVMERLKMRRAFAYDRHFHQYGFALAD